MKKIDELDGILKRMSFLFECGGELRWADSFGRLRGELAESPGDVVAKILQSFGGMGSLNDIVLYKDGDVMISETNELDALRGALYDLCQNFGSR